MTACGADNRSSPKLIVWGVLSPQVYNIASVAIVKLEKKFPGVFVNVDIQRCPSENISRKACAAKLP